MMESANLGVWIALGTLLISAATIISGAITMRNTASQTYVILVKEQMGVLRDRLEEMGKEHEGLNRDLAKCIADCERSDEKIRELTSENRDMLREMLLGKRMTQMGRAKAPQVPEVGS